MAVKIQDRVGGKKKTNPTSADRLRPRDDTRPKDWSPYVNNNTSSKKTNSNLTDRGYPSSTNPTSRPKRRDDYGGYSPGVAKKPAQTSLGNPKGLRDLEKPQQTSLGNPKGLRDLDKKTGKSSNTQNILREAMKASERSGTIRKLATDSKSVSTVSKAADRVVRNTTAAHKGYSGQSLRSSGEGKRYVSGEEYETYRKAKVQKQKDTEADRIKEAERRAAAGEPLRAKGEEKRYVSGAEYEAYRKAKAKKK